MEECQLSSLIQTENPWSVLDEIEEIVNLLQKDCNFLRIRAVFEDVIDLFEGRFPGFRGCNLEYHNLQHTTDTLLATARLIHGAVISKMPLTTHNIELGLITAILHDTGYIQEANDNSGTGAKYTMDHIDRSAMFMKNYYAAHDFTTDDFIASEQILRCTGLTVKVKEIDFVSPDIELLGKMLGTADLLGQMGDRAYLEKLLFLYKEFKEGGIGGYNNELDLLEKTVSFYEMTVNRMNREFDGIDRMMQVHFKARWNINRNLYAESIERQVKYLIKILDEDRDNYRSRLRRGGLVQKYEKQNE